MNQNNSWFLIPVKIFERAIDFYSILFDQKISIENDHKGYEMGLIKSENKILGCISANENYAPNNQGVIVYIDVGDKIDQIINNIIPAGGKIKMPKTKLSHHGYIAQFEDSEGNILGLYQQIDSK